MISYISIGLVAGVSGYLWQRSQWVKYYKDWSISGKIRAAEVDNLDYHEE